MSTKIQICHWKNQEKTYFIQMINPSYGCSRCGKTHVFTKSKNEKYLTQLQKLSGQLELPYPIGLDYQFYKKSEEQITIKHFFGKDTTKIKEYGDTTLELSFDTELSKEDSDKWVLIGWGLFSGLKALT
jgi:hypothetical protein